jgi:hypothetical protein
LILALLSNGKLRDKPESEEKLASETRPGYCLNQPSDRFLGEGLP